MIPYFTGQSEHDGSEEHVLWPQMPQTTTSDDDEEYDSFEDERAAHRISNESQNSFPDQNPIISFYLSKRHLTAGNPTPLPSNLPKLSPWRLRDRLKMVNGILLLCLNLDVDPPDVVKTQPCAVFECWVDPHSLPSNKAIEAIGTNLQHQFEALNPRMKYKPLLDPSVDDARKFCINLRKLAQDERCLFYYNGHGVPRPTASGELWVFNKTYSQYIPVSLWDLQNWLGSPCIYVWDTSSAGYLLSNYVRVAEQRDNELREQHGGLFPEGVTPFTESLQLAACLADEQLPMCPELPADLFTSCLTSPIEIAMRWFLLKATNLPSGVTSDMVMQIPGDLKDRRTPLGELNWIFTAVTDTIAWSTFPRETFKRLFRQDLLVAALFRNFLLAERIMKNYHCTPHTYPPLPPTNTHPMWASWDLAVDACVAQLPRIIRAYKANGEPIPEAELSMIESHKYVPSSFFADSLTAFDVWLGRGGCALSSSIGQRALLSSSVSSDPLAIPVTCDSTHKHALVPRKPPPELPIVLQVLLSQSHRLRALICFAQFCDLGPWAVNLALTIGIFPYILKLLLAPPGDLRPVLIFIWTRIVAVDPSVQADLYANHSYRYFAHVLQARDEPKFLLIPNAAEHRAMCAFVLAGIARGMRIGQMALLEEGVLEICLARLDSGDPDQSNPDHDGEVESDADYLLRQWLVLCIAQMWGGNDMVKDVAVGKDAPQLLMAQLGEEVAPDVRAAIVFALATFLGADAEGDYSSSGGNTGNMSRKGGGGTGSLPGVSFKGHYRIEAGVATGAVLAVREDASPVVRKEVVILISAVVKEWRGHFVVVCWVYWIGEMRAGRMGSIAKSSTSAYKPALGAKDVANEAIQAWLERLAMRDDADEEWIETQNQVLAGYFTLWATLLELAVDPFEEVARMAKEVVDWVVGEMMDAMGIVFDVMPHDTSSTRRGGRTRVSSLQSSTSNFNTMSGGGVPLTRTDTESSIASALGLKRTSSFAQALKSLGGYTRGGEEGGYSETTSTNTQANTGGIGLRFYSRPPSPSPSHTHSHRSPSVTTTTTTTTRVLDTPPVDIIEYLIKEDMVRLRARRSKGGAAANGDGKENDVKRREVDGDDVLPLKSRFYDWCNEYFTEPQMRQVESHEPGSTAYNAQLWRRERNERIIGEVQTQAEIAPQCKWDRPVSTILTSGAPLKICLHAYDSLLVTANEYDKISIWDWAQRKRLGVFSNGNPSSTNITSLRFINDDTDGLVVSGSSDGVVRIYRPTPEPTDDSTSPVQMLSAFRAMPSLVPIKRGPGLVLDWNQAVGTFTVGGDSRDIVVWDATSETKVDTISTQSNSPLTSIVAVADYAASTVVVAGFADGAVKAYDRRIRDADAVVRTYREHSAWVIGARCQRGNGKELVTASIDGEVHLWDSRYATRSIIDWQLHDRLAAFDVHEQTGVFAATSAVTPANWRSHTTIIHSLPPVQPSVLSRVVHPTGLHYAPSVQASYHPVSLNFHPNEMLYAVGATDGTIRLLGCKLQERREQIAAGLARLYELPQPRASFESSGVTSSKSFSA